MSNRYRKIDRVAELPPRKRSIKHPEPVPPGAYQDDGTGEARDPTEEELAGTTHHGPNYRRAMEHEAALKMCTMCNKVPPRKPNAKRCEACETIHRAELKRKSDANRRPRRRAKTSRGGAGAI
ncbi:MAG: hypothetical protein KAV00_01880 [Phycisphaerae bacterium]|nr:hypothetical protein [Phycisphaerae bacterium]